MELQDKPTSLKKAVVINFIGRYSYIVIQLIYSSILSSILTLEDFGIVAVVTVFTAFFTLIANMGIGPAIIQNADLDNSNINNIFSFAIYIGVIVGFLFVIEEANLKNIFRGLK